MRKLALVLSLLAFVPGPARAHALFRFPSVRERALAELVICAREMLQEGREGLDSVDHASSILTYVRLARHAPARVTAGGLRDSAWRCRKVSRGLIREPVASGALSDRIQEGWREGRYDARIRDALQDLSSTAGRARCRRLSAGVSGAFVVGGRLEAGVAECRGADGRRYLGPAGGHGVLLGMAAEADLGRTDSEVDLRGGRAETYEHGGLVLERAIGLARVDAGNVFTWKYLGYGVGFGLAGGAATIRGRAYLVPAGDDRAWLANLP